jgi:hypothetical protein
VREIPGSKSPAPASLLLVALLTLAAAGCPTSPPAPGETSSAAPSSAPVPSNRPLTDGPLVGEGPRVDEAPRPAGSEASAPLADAPLTVVGAAHILVAYKGALGAAKTVSRTKAEARKRAEEAREKLVAHQGTFEELVAKYSDDDLSKPAGGKIGNFERNVFPPAFTEAAFGMAVGGISEVVETPRGFHVLLRTK